MSVVYHVRYYRMAASNLNLQTYCEQLKEFNSEELRYIQDRVQHQMNKNITRAVQKEDLAFQEAIYLHYSHYQQVARENIYFVQAGVHNWTREQFRDFYEDHGDNWMTQLWMIAKQY